MKYTNLMAGLKEVGQVAKYRKGSHLAFQGEVPRYGNYILDGVVKAYVITPDGAQRLINIYAKHSMVPIAWLSDSSSTALFYYQAMTDVRTIRFTRSELMNLVATNREVNQDYIEFLARAHTSSLLRTTGLCQTGASHKICYALYVLALRYGVERGSDLYIPIPLTHETIGNFIGQSRENTAKTIKQLIEKNILSYQSKYYTIDKARLERFIGEDSFREVIG